MQDFIEQQARTIEAEVRKLRAERRAFYKKFNLLNGIAGLLASFDEDDPIICAIDGQNYDERFQTDKTIRKAISKYNLPIVEEDLLVNTIKLSFQKVAESIKSASVSFEEDEPTWLNIWREFAKDIQYKHKEFSIRINVQISRQIKVRETMAQEKRARIRKIYDECSYNTPLPDDDLILCAIRGAGDINLQTEDAARIAIKGYNIERIERREKEVNENSFVVAVKRSFGQGESMRAKIWYRFIEQLTDKLLSRMLLTELDLRPFGGPEMVGIDNEDDLILAAICYPIDKRLAYYSRVEKLAKLYNESQELNFDQTIEKLFAVSLFSSYKLGVLERAKIWYDFANKINEKEYYVQILRKELQNNIFVELHKLLRRDVLFGEKYANFKEASSISERLFKFFQDGEIIKSLPPVLLIEPAVASCMSRSMEVQASPLPSLTSLYPFSRQVLAVRSLRPAQHTP